MAAAIAAMRDKSAGIRVADSLVTMSPFGRHRIERHVFIAVNADGVQLLSEGGVTIMGCEVTLKEVEVLDEGVMVSAEGVSACCTSGPMTSRSQD
ncbi:MAG: hypothetical protein ED859_00750 [Desulfuromonadales bacterium]|nr:MAG: hypothetical protein ED859_00750 [Desulfuromonadales bacterium]